LYERILQLGKRAGVEATPHDFRHTFACDMIARGTDTYFVAQMLADTITTVEKTYAKFIQAARDAAQDKMATGIGIEERARLNKQRGQKVLAMRA
jgi:integrase